MDVLSIFMNVAGGISVSSVVEMLVSLVLTVRVVTVPIIMRYVTNLYTVPLWIPELERGYVPNET